MYGLFNQYRDGYLLPAAYIHFGILEAGVGIEPAYTALQAAA